MHRYKIIDLASWPRRDLFLYYQKYDSPCYTLSVKLPGESVHAYAKSQDESFFLLALYAVLRAANRVPQVRQRVVDGAVVEFEQIDAITAIMGPNEMFCHAWCEYQPDFPSFKHGAKLAVEAAKKGQGAGVNFSRKDMLCANCVPWLHFEGLSIAHSDFHQDLPILTWGKLQSGKIPFSVKFSHSFVDGLHAGRFFSAIEKGFLDPASLYRL